MTDLLLLKKMITPKVITFIYWLLLLGVAAMGLMTMFSGGIIPGMPGGGVMTFGSFLQGLLILVIGSVIVRVWCELMIVFFSMNEALQEIRKK